MNELVYGVLLSSLLGGVHCAGMCGGIVALYSTEAGPTAAHGAYHGTRLAVYALLGALAGAFGGVVELAGARAGIGRGAAVVAGSLVLGIGVLRLLEALGAKTPSFGPLGRGLGVLSRRVAHLGRGRSPVARAALLGASSALLPCGWLWAFVISAGAAGTALGGAGTMAVFWLGTLPALLALGLGLGRLQRLLGRNLPVVTAVVLIAVGLATVGGRFDLPAPTAAAEAPCHH